MLTQLSIRNLLLLKQCDIAFRPGLNALTGETGAGKSILLDGLGLVLGERSDAGLVRPGEKQASVSAEFEVGAHAAARALMEELGLEPSAQLILRRTLSADGKSRAFANDAAVSVSALKRFGELLVARHGQHDQRGLLDSKTHRDLLDQFAGNQKLLQQTAQHFSDWKAASAALDALETQAQAASREQEWMKQIAQELGAIDPQPGEELALTDIRKRAQTAQASLGALREALALLTENDGVALQLRQVAKLLARTALAQESMSAALERAETDVEEVSVAIERIIASAELDPRALESAEDRLHALRGAARKFNCAVENLPDMLADARRKLATLTNLDAERKALRAALLAAEQHYREASQALYAAREKASTKLTAATMKELKPLKMATTELRVVQTELPPTSWGAHGMHQVSFEVSTNAGMKPGPLNKVASGGELSRLLLAMKVVLHAAEPVVAIFDEIDTGTGGAVAEAIGQRLKQLAAKAQVIVVTHLPQVAAQASHHLFISKSGKKEVTTDVRELDAHARTEELARMLSGATISDEARKAADKMLREAS
ncbi:MAG: DNA repair protein RecN [Rickettsiales bacterium]